MVKVELLEVENKVIQGVMIQAPGGEGHPNMILLRCKKGYIMCGYLNQAAAEKFGDAAAIAGGASFEEILANPIKAVTPEAAALGVEVGMTGAQAAAKLNA